MAKIDIRNEVSGDIDHIIFCSNEENAYELIKQKTEGGFSISDEDYGVYVENKVQAVNMMKAVQKAIDLGWVK